MNDFADFETGGGGKKKRRKKKNPPPPPPDLFSQPPSVRGMVNKIVHALKVEAVEKP